MSFHKLFILEKEQSWQVGKSVYATFKDNVLTVNWKGMEKSIPAKVGDKFSIECCGKFPNIKTLKLPYLPMDKIYWILGFPKNKRCCNYSDFTRLLCESDTDWIGFRLYDIESDKYHITFGTAPETSKLYPIAAYIDSTITSEEISKMFIEYSKINTIKIPKDLTIELLDSINVKIDVDEVRWEQSTQI